MTEIIGVKFRNTGKIYYFNPGSFDIHYDDHVIVETARGVEYGTVVMSPMQIEDEKIPQPLKGIMRMADENDTARENENLRKEQEAYRICKEKIAERELDMKLIRAEYTFDNSKVLFYFTADGRIDFRELVKDLAGIFKTRIELRQIGVRDETKILGGMGICGRPLCCHTYLTEFAPVSIKMAKEQNLSLNPTKISGTCGRLMCCLKNEADTYAYLNKGMPGKGDQLTTPDGKHGEVQSVNILRQTVKAVVDMENDEKELQEFNVADITFIPHSRKPKTPQNQPKAADKAAKGEHGDKPEKGERGDKQDRSERGDKQDRSERGDKQGRGDYGDRQDRSERGDKPGRGDYGDRQDRSERGDRPGRGDYGDRSARGERTVRGEHGDRPERPAVRRMAPKKTQAEYDREKEEEAAAARAEAETAADEAAKPKKKRKRNRKKKAAENGTIHIENGAEEVKSAEAAGGAETAQSPEVRKSTGAPEAGFAAGNGPEKTQDAET